MCMCVCMLVTLSYPTLCKNVDYSPPGSSIHGIFQARILEWVAISFSRVLYHASYCPSPLGCHCLSVHNAETCLSSIAMIISVLVVLYSFCASLGTQDSMVRMGITCLELFMPCRPPASSLCFYQGSELLGHYSIATFSSFFQAALLLPRNTFCFPSAAASVAKSLQSCPTLCDPIDGSPTGSPIPGILQARTLEWVVISFSNA